MEKAAIGTILAATVLFATSAYMDTEEQHQWEAFKTSHACKAVAHINGAPVPYGAVDVSNKADVGPSFPVEKTGWQCNDGITYYR